MFVGNNVDGYDAFRKRVELGEPHGDPRFPRRLMPTWRNLYSLLDLAAVERAECFFTNAYVGLNGRGPTAAFAGARSEAFRSWCRDFLLTQIAVMRPRTVVALGAYANPALTTMQVPHLAVSHPARVMTAADRAADADLIRSASL